MVQAVAGGMYLAGTKKLKRHPAATLQLVSVVTGRRLFGGSEGSAEVVGNVAIEPSDDPGRASADGRDALRSEAAEPR